MAKTVAQRRAERTRERAERLWGPPGFTGFVRARPCVRCGRVPSEPHHEPTAAAGGTWRDISPVCTDCHTMGPGARHTVGVETFWAEVGMTYKESNEAVQRSWADHTHGLAF